MKYNIDFFKRYLKVKYDKWSYQFLRSRWTKATNNSKVHGLVLMYHNVSDDDIDTLPSCKCRVNVFKQTLERLRSEGYVYVTIDEALKMMKNHSTQKFVIVSFDDVPENVFFNAYPILSELRIPFVVFVATNLLNKNGYLSVEQIKEMNQSGLCTIGAHSVTHSRLRINPNSFEEMRDSKLTLESIFGQPIEYMAYPFGRPVDVSLKNIKEAEKAGYKCAFGTILAPLSDKSIKYPFYLPRYIIN